MNDILSKIGSKKSCPVIFLFKEGRVLIGLRNYTPDKWKSVSVWTTPGGRCDIDETLEQTLRREVKEEVAITEFEITNFVGEVPGSKEGDVVYVFNGITQQEPKLMEPAKFGEWRWCALSEVPVNFINPKALVLVRGV